MTDQERRLHIALAMIMTYFNDDDHRDDFKEAMINAVMLIIDLPAINFLPECHEGFVDETNGDYYEGCIRSRDLKAVLVAECVLSDSPLTPGDDLL